MRTPAGGSRTNHLIPWLIAHKASSKEKQNLTATKIMDRLLDRAKAESTFAVATSKSCSCYLPPYLCLLSTVQSFYRTLFRQPYNADRPPLTIS